MELFTDLLILFIIGVTLYALFGDFIKRIGLGHVMVTILDYARVGVGYLRLAVVWLGYRVLLGRVHWRGESVNEFNQSRTQIMSNDAPSVPSVPRDGAQIPAAVTPQLTYAPHVILDTLHDLRAHGFTRDQARAFTNRLHMPWKNELWSQVITPPDDDLMVTPYAGRATKRSYYPDTPELEYQEP